MDSSLCLCTGMHEPNCVADVAVVSGVNVHHHHIQDAFLHMQNIKHIYASYFTYFHFTGHSMMFSSSLY